MNRRPMQVLLAAALVTAAFATASRGDGFVVIRPPRRPAPVVPLAVQYHHVDVSIDDPVAVTKIDQIFKNPNPIELEGEYIFPLPEGSVVTEFTMHMDGQEVKGEILDAGKARGVYESIVRRQKDPALLEYVGTKMFKARVYPIPARGETRIGLTYSEMVPSDAGLRTYRYPLNTEKFSSKPLESVVVGVRLKTTAPLLNVYSPSHTIEVVRKGDREARASYEAKNLKPDQDFILYYATSEDALGLNVATWTPRREDGFFLLMLSPSVKTKRVAPKDVVFVIDTSLSMGTAQNDAMGAAKKALRYCVRALRPEDRFNVLDFSMEVRTFEKRLLPATEENVEDAVAYIDKMEARGATAIDDALREAMAMGRASDDRPFMVVFLTDGTPTWGERDTAVIRGHVKDLNTMKARVFAFGIGDDIDTLFLERLARDNHGARAFITGKEELEHVVTRFFDKVSNPILSDLALTIEGLRTFDVYPKPLPDLFKGDQIAVLGRFRGEGTHAVTLEGTVGEHEHRYVFEAPFGGKTNGGEFLPRFWASLKIGHLLEEIRLRGENRELKEEIVRLSKKYGIMNNRYVSFLVVEDEPLPRPAGSPTPAPGGRVFRLKAEEERDEGAEPEDMASGKAEQGRRAAGAIDKAKKGFFGSDAKARGGVDLGRKVKYVGERTFYLENGVWVDARYDGRAEVKEIAFLGDDYFALLDEHEGLNKFLALGDRVLVVVGDRAFRVVKKG